MVCEGAVNRWVIALSVGFRYSGGSLRCGKEFLTAFGMAKFMGSGWHPGSRLKNRSEAGAPSS